MSERDQTPTRSLGARTVPGPHDAGPPTDGLAAAGREIADWLIAAALDTTSGEALLEGLCRRLSAAGIDLMRVGVGARLLHPHFNSYTLRWTPNGPIEHEDHAVGNEQTAAWQRSPLRYLVETGKRNFRRRLERPEATADFPVLAEFRAQGGTDYLVMLVPFEMLRRKGQQSGMIVTWMTNRPGGFSDAEVALFKQLRAPLAVAVKIAVSRRIGDSLAVTYLGADAGRRVMSGEIERGAAETMRAVLLFCDLRGFTALSDRSAPADLLSLLDACFDAVVGPIEAHGGQVLKFMGDGLLATFGLDGRPRADVCREAMLAATEGQDRIARLNEERRTAGLPATEMDMALHLGDVMYGNVGASGRLDFTVIGPAVNEASRIEALCDKLGHGVLISHAFAAVGCDCRPYRLVSLGQHTLRGVGRPQELFTLLKG